MQILYLNRLLYIKTGPWSQESKGIRIDACTTWPTFNLAEHFVKLCSWKKWAVFRFKFRLEFVVEDPFGIGLALIQVMTWCLAENKPLPEPIVIHFTDTSGTGPQCAKNSVSSLLACLYNYSCISLNEAQTIIRVFDDVIRWKLFPRYWPFVRGIHRSPVNSHHKGSVMRTLMFLRWAVKQRVEWPAIYRNVTSIHSKNKCSEFEHINCNRFWTLWTRFTTSVQNICSNTDVGVQYKNICVQQHGIFHVFVFGILVFRTAQ